ncbi:tail-specific protease [Bizionia gelidisalsuginis]|uniref:Tail-specific protease n=2 Tax=Bizionia TaxID=283785 RepID=A0A8H2LGP9_9FLAO|nr:MULTISPECIES: carboxy terminal-processing peptidase [Bizionia]TYB78088.1 tail-specific protease [Bizionia saleffrena]TYC12134.1 tail-specific protease [Bizionia gelidisalsuginis]
MKSRYNILMLVLLLAFGSCSFTAKVDNDPDKDKLLIQIVTLALEQLHFQPKELNDNFSQDVYKTYLNRIDPLKRFFLQSDIDEFSKFENEIDDELKNYEIAFFNLTNERLVQRMQESKDVYKKVLSKPFDFNESEVFNTDYENHGYVKNKKELNERWRQILKFSTISGYDDLVTAQKNDTIVSVEGEKKEIKSLKKIEAEAREETLKNLDAYYTDFIDDMQRKDWFSMYINTIVEGFDPHTTYFAPKDKDRFDQQMSGKLEGIGARLQKKMDHIKVVELISGGPAWRGQEIEVGDLIVKVRQKGERESVSIVGMRIDDAIKLIKGPKGSQVILTMKKVDGTFKDVELTRDLIELEETYAKSSTVIKDDKKFGIINLPKFYIDFEDYSERNAASDVRQEIERLKEENIEGLILDLRNNGGGSLKTVVDIAGLFIKDGPIVQVKSTNAPKEVLEDTDQAIVWDGPLVIMVNELSASASEILAAAMQDYKRAIIIGSKQTYGKGTVQNIIDLNRMVRQNSHGDLGAIKITRQKFYRVNGGSTQLEGVRSDVVIPDRYSYVDIGERDQDHPLAWDKISAVNFDKWNGYYDYDATISNSKIRMANNNQLKLIEENAQWIKTQMDKNNFSLNYDDYKMELKSNEKVSKEFDAISKYETNLTFGSLPYETKLFSKDTILKEKRDRWHTNLSKDVYVEEALNVLNDLKMSYEINKVANIKE